MDDVRDRDSAPLLEPLERGELKAADQVLGFFYFELHRLASELMKGQPTGHTLQATALVNEAYLRLAGTLEPKWKSRGHAMSAAAKAMRSVLVDHARRRASRPTVSMDNSALDRILLAYESRAVDLVALEKALGVLAKIEPEMARAVELRFFAGLPMEQVAEILEMPLRTLERRWLVVRAWLHSRLS